VCTIVGDAVVGRGYELGCQQDRVEGGFDSGFQWQLCRYSCGKWQHVELVGGGGSIVFFET
jgi:hypothetical protein